jgi:hypothetical protein
VAWSPNSTTSGMEPMGSSNTVTGNVFANPLLTTGDHLGAGSPAIGLGLPGYATDDFEDKARTDGAPDAGAFER